MQQTTITGNFDLKFSKEQMCSKKIGKALKNQNLHQLSQSQGNQNYKIWYRFSHMNGKVRWPWVSCFFFLLQFPGVSVHVLMVYSAVLPYILQKAGFESDRFKEIIISRKIVKKIRIFEARSLVLQLIFSFWAWQW